MEALGRLDRLTHLPVLQRQGRLEGAGSQVLAQLCRRQQDVRNRRHRRVAELRAHAVEVVARPQARCRLGRPCPHGAGVFARAGRDEHAVHVESPGSRGVVGVFGVELYDLVVVGLVAVGRSVERGQHCRHQVGPHTAVGSDQSQVDCVLDQQLLLDQAVEHVLAVRVSERAATVARQLGEQALVGLAPDQGSVDPGHGAGRQLAPCVRAVQQAGGGQHQACSGAQCQQPARAPFAPVAHHRPRRASRAGPCGHEASGASRASPC